ncbi:response regulator transcription factor [Phenylobacterium sp. SCN 70-31]|uniref:response regulator transcription factor n=1 Tax=Phenylobacterium sp. SCN 70-31 TaxID=1660129 RepID=UPI00086ABF81|nr:response regulator transcription factor [Phenylobacterium sp. SCN 70-31]ODT89273.1 MAG: DNA-binding response regulator [Phenylobacterium sp. SCN 70-31]
MHILIVEDNANAARSAELILSGAGHNVAVTASGEEAVELAEIYDYDVVLMDIDLEDISGIEALRTLRLKKNATPVIMVSGAAEITAKVEALAAGADDYMTKPYHKDELSARITAVVRRSRGHTSSVIRTGPIELNLDTRQAAVAGYPVHLTPSEYKMLEVLSLRKNTVLTKEACLNHLYNGASEPEPKIIDVFICKLRKKIAAATGGEVLIETVWGGGYMLRDPKAGEQRMAA